MTVSQNGMTDGVHGELNPQADTNEPPENSLGKRPGKSAPAEKWVDYVVSLGADRTFVTEETEHTGWEIVDGRPAEVRTTAPALTRPELIALADRLGG